MKKQILFILCVCIPAAIFLPTIFAVAAEPENTDFEYAVIEDEIRGRRTGTLVENQRIMSADRESGSVLHLDNDTNSNTTIQELSVMEDQSLIEYFRTETENFQEEIDISQFNIEYDELTDTLNINDGISYNEFYEILIYSSPRSYYLISENGTYDYFYPVVQDGIIQYIYPIYSYFKDDPFYDEGFWINQDRLAELLPEIEENIEMFDAGIAEIKSIINEYDSDFEKLMKYHDYIVMNYSYDWDSFKGSFEDRTNNIALELLVRKKGLCTSMSILFNYLAMDIGLDTCFVTSYDNSNGSSYHTWNMVKVAVPEYGVPNECWFHVDTTWDENATEYVTDSGEHIKNTGKTTFDNFLVSDNMTWETHGSDAIEGVYYDKDCGAHNTALDNAPWRKASSQLAVNNGILYYFIDNDGSAELHRTDVPSSDEVLECFDGDWANGSSCPGLALKDNTIYYSTSNQICSYDILSRTITKTDIILADNQQIVGLYQSETGLKYSTAELNADGTTSLITMTDTIDLECTVSTPILSDGAVTVPISADLNKAFFVVVKNGDVYKMVTAETNSDIIIDNINENDVTVYVWDNNMKPYIDAAKL